MHSLWEFSSAGLEHLPYKQGVSGSSPLIPTKGSSRQKELQQLLEMEALAPTEGIAATKEQRKGNRPVVPGGSRGMVVGSDRKSSSNCWSSFCRDDPTRTDDPHVPNVVR